MNHGKLEVRLRAAVAGYVLRQWQVDCSTDNQAEYCNCRLKAANLSVLEGVKNAVLAPGYKKLQAN